jgi:hypothetical protein
MVAVHVVVCKNVWTIYEMRHEKLNHFSFI